MTQTDGHDLLVVRGLSKRFDAIVALNNLDFDISDHGVFGVIGPNGSGKTTLFNLISGLHNPSEGSIRYRGQELIGMSSHNIARLGIARTFQNVRIFPRLTVIENIIGAQTSSMNINLLQRLVPHVAEERERLEEAMNILDKIGLLSLQKVLAQELSLGDQKRLELGRTIACKSDILLLDEPAGGMTPQETEEMTRLIQKLAEDGMTILLIEHKMGMVMSLCQQVTVLNFGRKIAEGTPGEIQKDTAVIGAYLGSKPSNA